MGEVEVGADVGIMEAARVAKECAVIRRAIALSGWVGLDGKPVTSTGVLRKPDADGACAAIGVRLPGRFRSAGDIGDLHRVWTAARAIGLLEVSGGRAKRGPAPEAWPTGDLDLLERWLDGLRAVCGELGGQPDKSLGLRVLLLAALMLLQGQKVPLRGMSHWPIFQVADEILREHEMSMLQVDLHGGARALDPGSFGDNTEAIIGLLVDFGAVLPGAGTKPPAATSLGRWLQGRLAAELPRAVARHATPSAAIREAADALPQGRWMAAQPWLAHREPAAAVRELLESADSMPAKLRAVAVDMARMTGEEGLPGWAAVASSEVRWPNSARHARAELYAWDKGAQPGVADWQWLGIDAAAAALEDHGADEALCRVWELAAGEGGIQEILALVRGSGHPEAKDIVDAVNTLVASGVPLTIDQGVQLKVTLKYFRPPVWRSVQVPLASTLGELHHVIQVLFGWGGDHLHDFTVAGARYSDPLYGLEEVGDEDEVRIRDAFPAGARKAVLYEYDFGASWIHEIRREKALRLSPDQAYPVCTGFSGDSPVEYVEEDEDESEEHRPFSLAAVNAALIAGTQP